MNVPFPIRKECPPGACVCDRELLLADPQGDLRVLRLTKEEEKRLVSRLESLASFEDLKHMEGRLQAQLGIVLHISPSANEVRTVRGLSIEVEARPGLCRKTRDAIPAALRRAFENHPHIVYALLDSHDLLGGAWQAGGWSRPGF
ncbi:hypothetical protein PIGHUM_02442 [Pigmentiphaga humi]|uniref:Ribosomal protein S3AE n=1 Tax=Pigmentiphaga humi TaxID=2478468 RepID=A0A3P4B3V5_9BURK|nr:hypothetical protein [Pigmentiphaga humi]VCU70370.1 hypothetical protein PIGHUM_02442 [Pigmentiphaga humi]